MQLILKLVLHRSPVNVLLNMNYRHHLALMAWSNNTKAVKLLQLHQLQQVVPTVICILHQLTLLKINLRYHNSLLLFSFQLGSMAAPSTFKRRSSFQVSWHNEFPWIEYSIERDAVFCFPCRFFGEAPDYSLTLVTLVGFRDWKHAKGKSGTLTSHDRFCSKHHDAVLSWQSFKSSVSNNSSVVE